MLKYSLVILLLIPSMFHNVFAQIGINIEKPLSTTLLHIDPAKNSSGTTPIYTDDVVVTTNGNLGIGTVAPITKLDIAGAVRINDGSAVPNYVLTSNSIGRASWKEKTSNKIGIWNIKKTTSITVSTNPTLLTGTGSLLENQIELVNKTDGVELKPGKYLVFLSGSLTGHEYGFICIYNKSTGKEIARLFYVDIVQGANAILTLGSVTTIELRFQHIQTTITSGAPNYSGATSSSFTSPNGFSYTVNILQLM